MKDKLLKLLKAKEESRTALVAKSEKSEDVAELRAIHSQIEGLNAEITELRGMVSEAEAATKVADDDEALRTKIVNANNQPESRSYQPGRGFTPTTDGEGGLEDRAKGEEVEREKRGKELKEGRAVTVGSSSIVIPAHQVQDIRPTFNQISSLIDNVNIMPLNGGESFTQPYLIDIPAGGYTLEQEEYFDADAKFGKAEISKAKITAYSETTEEVKKLPAAAYEEVVMSGITKSMRRKITRQILIGDGGTNRIVGIFSDKAAAIDPATDLSISTITNTTLDDILFGYGYDEDVESVAVLVLNKLDLKAFSQLRTYDGKKFHDIKTNGNTGTIDGVPFIINSACGAVSSAGTPDGTYCMVYGLLSNYMLAVFSDADVQRSEEFKFRTGEIAHRGSIFLGGNVVSHNGFLRIKKGTAI